MARFRNKAKGWQNMGTLKTRVARLKKRAVNQTRREISKNKVKQR
jgi:hypothetical protein